MIFEPFMHLILLEVSFPLSHSFFQIQNLITQETFYFLLTQQADHSGINLKFVCFGLSWFFLRQGALKLAVYPGLDSNLLFSFLGLPCARITGIHHHAQLILKISYVISCTRPEFLAGTTICN
jgi:hypothetical protein